MIQLYPLYRLQQVDSKIDLLTSRVGAADGGAELHKKIRAREHKLQVTDKEFHRLKTLLKDSELQLATVESHAKDIEKKLYAGRITNPKELAGFNTELEQLRAQKSDLEDKVLDLMEKVEDAKGEVTALETRLQKARNELEDREQRSDTTKRQTEQQLEELRKKRESLAQEIESALMTRYETLRKRKDGIAVARLDGITCGECGTGLPESIKRRIQERQLEVCSYCERILFTD